MSPARLFSAPARLVTRDSISRPIAFAVDLILRRLPMFDPLRHALERIARFASVGIASSLLYALAVTAETALFGINPDLSAVLAYAITIPFNFLLHRHFTFNSAGTTGGDLTRYGCAQTVSIVVSWAAMTITVDAFGLSYGVGILGGIVAAPIVTYLLLNRWVFTAQAT